MASSVTSATTAVAAPNGAPILAHTTINGARVYAYPNPSLNDKDGSPKSHLDHLVAFTKTTSGAFRIFHVMEKTSRVVALVLSEMGSNMSVYFEKMAGKLGIAWAMLTLPRLPEVTQAASRILSAKAVDPRKAIHDLSDAAATYSYAGLLLTSNPLYKNLGDAFDLAKSVIDMEDAAEEYGLAQTHLEHINTNDPTNVEIQQRFADTQRYALLKLIKEVAGVFSGAVGLLALTMGGPLVSGTVLLGVAFVSSVVALAAHFFKETRPYTMVDFPQLRPVIITAN